MDTKASGVKFGLTLEYRFYDFRQKFNVEEFPPGMRVVVNPPTGKGARE
ncbi:MAG: hypothetical protein ABSH39_14765 [Candidatus Acidiferrum sp.]